MTEEARGEWLAVAWQTLKHLPADLLAIGAEKARLTADHPSKIVPAIIAETQETLNRRRRFESEYGDRPRLPAPETEPEYCTPEQAARILEEVGLKSKFASNRR